MSRKSLEINISLPLSVDLSIHIYIYKQYLVIYFDFEICLIRSIVHKNL